MQFVPSVIAVCICASVLSARAEPEVLSVWPDGKIPLLKNTEKKEHALPSKDTVIRITDVSHPTLTVYRANAGKQTPAVVICPGGGYGILAFNLEGTEIAEWFVKRGITAFILKYRVPAQPDAAFCDAQRALSFVRANAAAYRIHPSKIGIIGFSAGANLSARVSTNYGKRLYSPVDETDAVSCRPDFSMIIYPWHLIQGQDKDAIPSVEIRPEYPVDRKTPPAFIVQSEDDGCHVENSIAYFHALKKANVPVEMHLFAKGGHGYGIRIHNTPTDIWPTLAETWLNREVKKEQ